MLKGKQKRYLRSLAHNLQPVMQIGKSGLTDNFIHTFIDAIDTHELIKVSVLQNCMEPKEALGEELCQKTDSDLVQIIGNQLIFYRPTTKENKESKIVLP
ncbi:ribosome assembly RNA-binding protein YhbY [Mycoplasmatota bacterium]|nr:ribosome assembly RNA-binding protein YhbY [Mycoplasmatota bacterium]